MSLRKHLNIVNITVNRVTTTQDAYGDPVTTTLSTIVERAALWSPTQNDIRLSDKIASMSTHILAIEYGKYSFTSDDSTVVANGVTYKVVGPSDNVSNQNKLVLQGLELIT